MNHLSFSQIRDQMIPRKYQKVFYDTALRTRNTLRYSQAGSYSRSLQVSNPVWKTLDGVRRSIYELGLGVTHISLELFSSEKLPR